MRKHFKKIICMISVFVFAFCPLLFSGCDTTDVDPSGNTTKPSYKVNDYLSAMKVAYTPALNSSADDEITSYANEVLGLTEILAVDTLVNLLENYYDNLATGETIERSDSFDSDIEIKIERAENSNIDLNNSVTVEYYDVDEDGNIDENAYYNFQFANIKQEQTGYSAVNTFRETVVKGTNTSNDQDVKTEWKSFDKLGLESFNDTISRFLTKFLGNKTNANTLNENSVVYQMMYAILKISNTFYNVTNDGFNDAYNKFKTEYNSAIENGEATEEECRQLAITSKHSGLISGKNGQQSSEQRAFKQYILDYIIGDKNVTHDNELFEVWDNNKKEYVTPKANEKYSGESYYYFYKETNDANNYDLSKILNRINEVEFQFATSDIEQYSYVDLIWTIYKGIDGNNDNNTLLKVINDLDSSHELVFDSGTKLWQDFNNDGRMDIVWATDSNENIIRDNETNAPVPKYRATSGEFRNYDWTVEQIVKNVLSKSEIIYNEETITGYPTVSNVFSRDYEYSAMEISSNDLNAKYTCSLPRNAYKSIVICAKDRSDKDIKNNIGFVNMVLESAEGVSVDVKIYARYYRSGSGYAKWDSKISNELDGTLYPLVDTLKINGPYKVDLVDGQIQDSSLEINVQEMFKKAKFNDVENSKKFDFTYTDSNNQSQTKQIYEIEPFVDGYYNTSINKAVHASVFGLNGKTNPRYNSFTLSTGETIYSYDNKNLDGEQSEYGYLEILFVPSNENAFTFGLLGYVPENEFSL